MKKIFLIITTLCLLASAASAQEQKQENDKRKTTTDEWTVTEEGDDELGHFITETTYQKGVYASSSAGRNWTVTGGLGAQFYMGDNDWKGKFRDLITGPVFDLYFNKWFTPNFGLGIGFTYSPFRGLYKIDNERAAFRTDEYYGTYNGQQLYRQKGQTFNPFVIALVDLDNLFGGYKPQRIYNLAMYAGGGVIFGTDPVQTRCGATFNLGFLNIFKVGKRLDLMINVRGSLVSDSFEGESRSTEPQTKEYITANIPFDGTAGITAGLQFHFGKKDREWQSITNVTKTYTGYADAKNQIKELQSELEKANSENQALLALKKEKVVITPDLWYHVQFQLDKWDISNRERVNLKSVADQMKAAPEAKFSICGYADVQTATPDHNLMLSKNRVAEVFKVLTQEFGVNPDQLVQDYKGGVDLMFYDENTLSRCVIIKSAGK